MANLPRRPSHCEDDIRCTVKEQKVFVESFQFSEAHNVVVGTVRVWNIDPMKRVFTRYTLDNWETHIDLEATWEGSIGDEQWPQTDQFALLSLFPVSSGVVMLSLLLGMKSQVRHSGAIVMERTIKL